MKKSNLWKKLLSAVLSLAMVLALLPTSALAVEGSQVAADGTYSSSISILDAYPDAAEYMDEDEDDWEDYTVTVKLVVSNGVFSEIVVSTDDDIDETSATRLTYTYTASTSKRLGIASALTGATATAEAIENWDGNPSTDEVDAVSSATCSYYAVKAAALAAIETAEEASSFETTEVEILDVTYVYGESDTAVSGYTNISGTDIYYAVADNETAISGTLYGTASLTYEEFYEGYVTEGYTYDAVTTATTSDYSMFTNAYTNYDEDTSTDGYDILGVSNVNIAVDAEIYVEAAILTAAGEDLEGVYEEAAAVTLNYDYTTAPSQYKVLESDGSYSGSLNVIATVTDATVDFSTNTTWGEYEIDVIESSTSNLRNSRSDTFPVGSNITGIILTTEEGTSVGLAYLANIWIQCYKLSFNATDTSATRNISYSGATDKYQALVGETITSITYLTADGAYVYTFEDGIYVKPSYSGTVTAVFDDDLTVLTVDTDTVPSDIEDGSIIVEYTVGSGKTAVSYTLYEGEITSEITVDTSVIEGVTDGTYSATISSSNYADIDVAICIQDSQIEELEALIETAQNLIDSGLASEDATLASHVEEAEELIANSEATMAAADELIAELEELLAEYPSIIKVGNTYYAYVTEETDGYTQIDDSGIYYAAVGDGLSGTIYGTASLTYDEFYSGDVTENYTYDAVTTATTGDYDMFDNAYTDYDEETSTDGYNILGVSDVNIAVDAEFYVESAILSVSGVELTDAQAEAAAITINDDPTEVPSQYKTLSTDGTYSATTFNVVATVTDASAVLNTGSTWGEYEIDVYEDSTLYLRNSRSNTYTDDDGNTQTYAVGSNITGIILTTEDGTSVGLAYLANIWIQPYKLSFNATDTTATRNIAYSGDTAKYAAIVGKTITSITYLTNDGAYVYTFADGIYVKPNYDGTVEGDFSSDMTTFTLDLSTLPEDITNGVLTIEYTVGSGKTAQSYTLAQVSLDDIGEDGTITVDLSKIEGLDGEYSVTLSSGNYADIDVEVSILDEQVEDLEDLIALAESILATIEDSTLSSHKSEAEELLANEDATMSEAYDLISELEELVANYVTTVEIGGVLYYYSTYNISGSTQLEDTEYYYGAADADDAYDGTIYGTASLTYAEFYSGDVTDSSEYDAVTTATTDDYSMFDNAYTDYDEETSTDGYNILGVSNVNIAVDADFYVESVILQAAGEELSDAQEEAVAITLNDDPTTEPSQYKTLSSDGTYSATKLNIVDTVDDATASLSTGSTWGEYEIDVIESSTTYLRNSRSNTYDITDEDGNVTGTGTFAVGSNITGIILTTESGYSVGLEYLANIWIQPYKLSFNAYDTTATRNIAYSGLASKFEALVGETIVSITYLTTDEAYVYTFANGIYVKPSYNETVTGYFSEDMTTFTLNEIPDVENGVITVEYTIGSGKTAVSYVLYEGTLEEMVTLDLSVIADAEEGGTYSVTISSDDYADIDVTIVDADTETGDDEEDAEEEDENTSDSDTDTDTEDETDADDESDTDDDESSVTITEGSTSNTTSDTSDTSSSDDTTQTGDANMSAYMVIMLLAAAVIAAEAVRRKYVRTK